MLRQYPVRQNSKSKKEHHMLTTKTEFKLLSPSRNQTEPKRKRHNRLHPTTPQTAEKKKSTKSVWSNHFTTSTTHQWTTKPNPSGLIPNLFLLCFWGATVNKALSSEFLSQCMSRRECKDYNSTISSHEYCS